MGRRGVIFPSEQGRDFGENAFTAPARTGDFEKELLVVMVRQHHKQRGKYHVALWWIFAGGTVEPAAEIRSMGFQRFPLDRRCKIHIAERTQPV